MNDAARAWNQLPDSLTWQEKAAYLSWRVSQLPQAPMPVTHLFEGGQYIREMLIPAQTVFLGRVHRVGHQLQLLEGEVILCLPTGPVHKRAPECMQTCAGFQAIAFTLTDVRVRSLHPDTGERDIPTLEASLADSADAQIAWGASIQQRLT